MEREIPAERQRQLPMRRRSRASRPSGRLSGSGAHQSLQRRDTAPGLLPWQRVPHAQRRARLGRHGGDSIAPQAPLPKAPPAALARPRPGRHGEPPQPPAAGRTEQSRSFAPGAHESAAGPGAQPGQRLLALRFPFPIAPALR